MAYTKEKAAILFAVVAALCAATPAMAQFAKAEDAIKYRKATFTAMATHFGRVSAMANGKVLFDAKSVADNAALAAVLGGLPYAAFIDGTDKGETRAKPEVWAERAKFDAAATKAQDELGRLNVAAKGGDIEAIKAAAGSAGKACKSCHDNFRKE